MAAADHDDVEFLGIDHRQLTAHDPNHRGRIERKARAATRDEIRVDLVTRRRVGESVILGGLALARHPHGIPGDRGVRADNQDMPDVPDASSHPAAEIACRTGCGACCIAPSITSAIPGMPDGKPAGVRCIQLDADMRCRLFGRPERPAFCGGLRPSREMCGDDAQQAVRWLEALEQATSPR
jgi:hypothetical protein